MSAFIVSDETMHRVVQAMDVFGSRPEGITKGNKENTQVGVWLFEMNNDAIRERYSNRYPDMFTDPEHYQYQHVEASTAALYRAVACFTYQCNEGNVPHTTLFKLVQEVEYKLEEALTGDPLQCDERTTRAMELTEDQPWDF